jgi:predicted nucleic acid-binding protein
MTKTCLPDVNDWLALTFQRHGHHRVATAWMAALPPAMCVFCRITQQGFLRLATNPIAFGNEALTMTDAWDAYDQMFDDPRVA